MLSLRSTLCAVALLSLVVAAHAEPAAPESPAKPAAPTKPAGPLKPLLPSPHPLITEVLFDVPRNDGDADGDGSRSATGDEFIELVNPHKETINLKGYTLHDVTRGKKGAMQFTFPDCPLKPGAVVVVFNGFESKLSGAVGDSKQAAESTNPRFAGAMVFSMKIDSSRAAMANGGDTIVLEDPDGKPVHVITWGKAEGEKPKGLLNEDLKGLQGVSAGRRDLGSPMVEHTKLTTASFSPGRFPNEVPEAPGKKSDAPDDPDRPKPKSKKGG